MARPFFWFVVTAWLILLSWQVFQHGEDTMQHGIELVAWVCLLAAMNLLPISGWYSTTVAADLPLAVAAALVLTPTELGLVAFVGALDPKEFQGRISLEKALFNRSQVAIADFSACFVCHRFAGAPGASSLVVFLAYVALSSIVLTNIALVAPGIALDRKVRLGEVVRRLYPGTIPDILVTFLAWGALGVMLVTLYERIGVWALVVFVGPTMLGRQVLARSQGFLEAARARKVAERALLEVTKRIVEERFDERRLIAADLHDEVLQPLFHVTLMAQVLKRDLLDGRLLELDHDLPDLLGAAELASITLRGLISDLRRSPLGRDGLGPALARLAEMNRDRFFSEVKTDLTPVRASPETQLAIYQIAKEAISNAIAHSGAKTIWVALDSDEHGIHLLVMDDGHGFDSSAISGGHFGIEIMNERAAAIGATLRIDTTPGSGTRIDLLAPLEP